VQLSSSLPSQAIDAGSGQDFSRNLDPVTCETFSLAKLRLASIVQGKNLARIRQTLPITPMNSHDHA
jgi:hypothetical protein